MKRKVPKCPDCGAKGLIEVARTKEKFKCEGCGSQIEIEVEWDGFCWSIISPDCSCGHKIEREEAHHYWGLDEKIIAVMCAECDYIKEISNV